MGTADAVAEFVCGMDFAAIPADVRRTAVRCTTDLIASAAGGVATRMSAVARGYSARCMPGGAVSSRILLDGRRASRSGAALAGGATFDAFDIHDGHRDAKGHAGAAVLPAVLAFADSLGGAVTGAGFLGAIVAGYEIALRAGVAMDDGHDFPSSGAWAALGVAAAGVRLLGLDEGRAGHALGIAEYTAPRSPVTRCLEHPTMLKDGVGWGAMAGVTAAELAAEGFTGAPAMLCAAPANREIWSDLGQRWYMRELYFRDLPSCRMAQPAITAALQLLQQASLTVDRIARISVASFAEAGRLMNRSPRNAEEAQYSLPYILACALHNGRVDAGHLSEAALADPDVARTSARVAFSVDPALDALWPRQRQARVTFALEDGRSLTSPPTAARGDPETPFTAAELDAKYERLMVPLVGEAAARRIRSAVEALDDGATDCIALLDDLLSLRQASAV